MQVFYFKYQRKKHGLEFAKANRLFKMAPLHHHYQKSGFHQIDVRKNYYPKAGGGKEHAVIMVKMCSDNFADLFKM